MDKTIVENPTRWIFRVGEKYIDIYEGTGDNLLREDIQEGYTGYYNYEIHQDTPVTQIVSEQPEGDCDGGMYMVKEPYHTFTTEKIQTVFKEYLKDDVDDTSWELIHVE